MEILVFIWLWLVHGNPCASVDGNRRIVAISTRRVNATSAASHMYSHTTLAHYMAIWLRAGHQCAMHPAS